MQPRKLDPGCMQHKGVLRMFVMRVYRYDAEDGVDDADKIRAPISVVEPLRDCRGAN